MNEIRIAIVGLGHRAVGAWIPLLQQIPGFRITAICDWIKPLHERALARIPYRQDVRCFTEYEDLLAWDGIDAVGLCVRRPDQGAMAAQALRAGKHVHSEVPAAHSIADCWDIVLAAEQTGKLYHLAEQVRFAGFTEAWTSLVHQGRLGRIIYAEGQYIGHYGTDRYFQDYKTGQHFNVDGARNNPNAKPAVIQTMEPIEYLPHELSPILRIMDDRVAQVVGMGTAKPSYKYPEIQQSDIQVALMKTEKDAVLRMACGFTVPVPHNLHHWYHLHGTNGRLEFQRSTRDRGKMWLADGQMDQPADVDWGFHRTDASEIARLSGHDGCDFYTHEVFRNALIDGHKPVFDVYRAMDTAAPAILASQSIKQGSIPLMVPDFRPGANRKLGQPPKAS